MIDSNFLKNWIETYYTQKEKNLNRSRVSSLLIFLLVFSLFTLQINSYNQLIRELDGQISSDLYSGIIKALVFQATIVLGLFVRFLALRFKGKFAFRFAEAGVLIAFFAWLGHFVWTNQWMEDASKFMPVCFPPILLYTPYLPAVGLTFGFIGWFFYKIIFLIAVTWKTVRE